MSFDVFQVENRLNDFRILLLITFLYVGTVEVSIPHVSLPFLGFHFIFALRVQFK